MSDAKILFGSEMSFPPALIPRCDTGHVIQGTVASETFGRTPMRTDPSQQTDLSCLSTESLSPFYKASPKSPNHESFVSNSDNLSNSAVNVSSLANLSAFSKVVSSSGILPNHLSPDGVVVPPSNNNSSSNNFGITPHPGLLMTSPQKDSTMFNRSVLLPPPNLPLSHQINNLPSTFSNPFMPMMPFAPGFMMPPRVPPQPSYSTSNHQLISCTYCVFQTHDTLIMNVHEQLHRSQAASTLRPFSQPVSTCVVCGDTFYNTHHLMQHIDIHHKESGLYKCDLCPFTSLDLLKLSTHTSEKHSIIGGRLYQCTYCGFSTKMREFFVSHMESHVQRGGVIHSPTSPFGSESAFNSSISIDNKRFSCPECSYSCEARQTLEKHLFYHQITRVRDVGSVKSSGDEVVAKPEHMNIALFKCDQCDFTSSAMSGIVSHQKNHQYTSHECKICHFVVHSRDALEDHMKVHKIDGEFVCDICGTMLRTLQKIVQHRRTHTGEKPFQCPHCSYRCSRKDNLKLHARRHALRKFHCPQCKFVTDNEPHLQKHVIRKHLTVPSQLAITNGSPPSALHNSMNNFTTSHNDMEQRSNAISTHFQLSHEDYETEFIEPLDFSKHDSDSSRNSFGDNNNSIKPYICTMCGYIGMSAYKLNEHMRIHTGEKPFKCSICEFRCARKGNLALHMRRHSVDGLVPGRNIFQLRRQLPGPFLALGAPTESVSGPHSAPDLSASSESFDEYSPVRSTTPFNDSLLMNSREYESFDESPSAKRRKLLSAAMGTSTFLSDLQLHNQSRSNYSLSSESDNSQCATSSHDVTDEVDEEKNPIENGVINLSLKDQRKRRVVIETEVLDLCTSGKPVENGVAMKPFVDKVPMFTPKKRLLGKYQAEMRNSLVVEHAGLKAGA